MADRRSFLSRLTGLLDPGPLAVVPANGNGKHAKSASGVSFTGGLHFAPAGEGIANIVRLDSADGIQLATAYAVSAYAFVAMRYRAEKLGEPPLMVVKESPDDSTEEWLPDHPLAEILETPSTDYDMGELLHRTSLYLDQGGRCLWVLDGDRVGRPGRITPFRREEFTVEATPTALRGRFRVTTATGDLVFGPGPAELDPERCILFIEPHPTDWTQGIARLDVALRWLNLSESTRKSVRELVENAVWPSVIVQTDPTWNPGEKEFALFKEELDSYAKTKGKPIALLGGGSATVVAMQLKDMLPEGLLNRVESVVSSIFGIPSIVLQFQVGMENAPWSQMQEARRMCAEDTLDPRWRDVERRLTRQLLRRVDEDPTHFIRFDRSTVKALQADRVEQATLASLMAMDASLNERRNVLGLDMRSEPEADLIPALERLVNPPPIPPAFGGPAPGQEDEDLDRVEDEEPAEDEPAGEDRAKAIAAARRFLRAKAKGPLVGPNAVSEAERSGFYFSWRVLAERQLATDQAAIGMLAERILGGAKALDDVPSDAQRKRFLKQVEQYLRGVSAPRWKRATDPMTINQATREASAIVSELGIRFDLVQPDVVRFALEESAFLVKNVSEATMDGIRLSLAAGFESGASAGRIASDLRSSGEFAPSRARLIARTEVGRAQNGAAHSGIKAYSERTGKQYEKVWDTAGDDRVRDEHAAMEGEAVAIDHAFSNGLQYPSEPNCRCRTRYREVTTR
jgi:SPP1 gp7 family putative phage head morphogenesis protein